MPTSPSVACAFGLLCLALGCLLGCRSAPASLGATDAGAHGEGTVDAIVAAGGADAAAPSFSFPPPPDASGAEDAWAFANPWCRSWDMLVCFGTDPAPYEQYLIPQDGGRPVGQCPTLRDFYSTPLGEGCLWVGCGPGDPDAGSPPDAAAASDAAPPCCFRVAHACGV